MKVEEQNKSNYDLPYIASQTSGMIIDDIFAHFH
jgi:hypothetical protein